MFVHSYVLCKLTAGGLMNGDQLASHRLPLVAIVRLDMRAN